MKVSKMSITLIYSVLLILYCGNFGYSQQVTVLGKSQEKGFIIVSKQAVFFLRTQDSMLATDKLSRLRVNNKNCFRYIDPINVINIMRAKGDSLDLSKAWFKEVADKKKEIIVSNKKYIIYPVDQGMVLVSIIYPRKKEKIYFTFPW